MNSKYIIIGFIVLVLLLIYYRSIINKEDFVGDKPCYGNIGSRDRRGNDNFYTNFMLDTNLNRVEQINEQKSQDMDTIIALQKYKDNILESNNKFQNDLNQFKTLNSNIDGAFNRMHSEVNKSVTEANTRKSDSLDVLGKIGSKLGSVFASSTESSIDERLKPIVKSSLENQLNLIQFQNLQNNKVALQSIASRVSDKENNLANWQYIPETGQAAPLRIDPITGEIQCLSFDGRNCDAEWISKNGNDFSKIDTNKMKPLSCGVEHQRIHGNDGYSVNGHWCRNAYKYYSDLSIENNDYSACPKGWTLIDADKEICQAPANYTGPCVGSDNQVKKLYPERCGKNICAFFNNEHDANRKREWSNNCNVTYPFKINIKSITNNIAKPDNKISNVIQNRLGNTNVDIIDKFKPMKNGILVKAYRLTPNLGRGEQIFENMITTTINFRWGTSTILGIQPNGADRIFLDFSGFLKVPKGVNTLKFRLSSDDGSRLLIAENGDINNLNVAISMPQIQSQTSKESNLIQVTGNTYLPFAVEFFDNDGVASLILEWSLNNKPFQVIPRDAYFLDRSLCSNTIKVGFSADQNPNYLNTNMPGASLLLNQNGMDFIYNFSQGGIVNKINKRTGEVLNIGGSGKELMILNGNMYLKNNTDNWFVDQNTSWYQLIDPSIITFLNRQLELAKTNQLGSSQNKLLNFRNFGGIISSNTNGSEFEYSFFGNLDNNGNRNVKKINKETNQEMKIGGTGTNLIVYNNKIYLINASLDVFSDDKNIWMKVNDTQLKKAILEEFRRLRPIVPKPTGKIIDCGYPSMKQGWYDIQGQGERNDYCRYVGGGNDPLYFSCAINGLTNNTPVGENIPENMPNDPFLNKGSYGC